MLFSTRLGFVPAALRPAVGGLGCGLLGAAYPQVSTMAVRPTRYDHAYYSGCAYYGDAHCTSAYYGFANYGSTYYGFTMALLLLTMALRTMSLLAAARPQVLWRGFVDENLLYAVGGNVELASSSSEYS